MLLTTINNMSSTTLFNSVILQVHNFVPSSVSHPANSIVRAQKLEEMEQHAQCNLELEASEDYREYFNYVLENEDLHLPSNAADAFELYQKLIGFACSDD